MNRNRWYWVLALVIAFLLAILLLMLRQPEEAEITTTTQEIATTTSVTATTIPVPAVRRRRVTTTTVTTTTAAPTTTRTTTTTVTTTTLPEAAAPRGGWFVKAGYFAGGGRLCFGYELPLNPSFNAALDAGYGAGNNFTVASLNASLIYPLSRERFGINRYLGLEANYSDFSKKVIEVPLGSDIQKGGGFGAGVILGVSRDNLFIHGGYDSRTGLLAEGGMRL